MNFDKTIERFERLATVSMLCAFTFAAVTLSLPATQSTALDARQSGECIVLSGSGIDGAFAVCGEHNPLAKG